MTHDEIIEMAQECNLIGMRPHLDGIYSEALIAFAQLVAATSQRPWVGLTDEEIAQGCKESWVTEQAFQSAVWWAEAKLKEKNNA